jgi:SpoVK/Ycf46/Vps4 family AAA+-type ATPase
MELERAQGIVVLTTNHAENLDAALERRIRYKIHFGPPGAEQRAEIWRKHIPAKAPLGSDVDFDKLGQEHELTGGQIANAVLVAAASAASRIKNPGDGVTILMADFETAARRERSGYDEADQKPDKIGF